MRSCWMQQCRTPSMRRKSKTCQLMRCFLLIILLVWSIWVFLPSILYPDSKSKGALHIWATIGCLSECLWTWSASKTPMLLLHLHVLICRVDMSSSKPWDRDLVLKPMVTWLIIDIPYYIYIVTEWLSIIIPHIYSKSYSKSYIIMIYIVIP